MTVLEQPATGRPAVGDKASLESTSSQSQVGSNACPESSWPEFDDEAWGTSGAAEVEEAEEAFALDLLGEEAAPEEGDGSATGFESPALTGLPPAAAAAAIGAGAYEVVQGDCLSSIAYRAGFHEKTLWDHANNAELKSKRKDPNVLKSGDAVFIPEKQLRVESGATEQRHRFRRHCVPAKFRVRLMAFGEPRRNVAYVLVVDGESRRGTADGEGYLEESIPPDARQGRLIVDPGERQEFHDLVFGGVDPLDELSGVQSRLVNLGYDCEMTGEMDKQTQAALADFQNDHKIEVTGRLDEQTRQKLKEVHES